MCAKQIRIAMFAELCKVNRSFSLDTNGIRQKDKTPEEGMVCEETTAQKIQIKTA